MHNRLLLAAAGAAGALAAFAGPAAAIAAPPVVVAIKGMEFSPSLTIEPGTTITWVNEDEAPHTVTDKGGVFRSAALDTGERFSYTFAKPGEFTYYCTLHPMMVGKIVVRQAG